VSQSGTIWYFDSSAGASSGASTTACT
jgi:hypothetical protein